jgi:hypothetical protein
MKLILYRRKKTAQIGGKCEANNGLTPIEGGKPLPIGKKKSPRVAGGLNCEVLCLIRMVSGKSFG